MLRASACDSATEASCALGVALGLVAHPHAITDSLVQQKLAHGASKQGCSITDWQGPATTVALSGLGEFASIHTVDLKKLFAKKNNVKIPSALWMLQNIPTAASDDAIGVPAGYGNEYGPFE